MHIYQSINMMHYACCFVYMFLYDALCMLFCFRIFLDFPSVVKTRVAREQTNGFLAFHFSKFKNNMGRLGGGGGALIK